jgi:hypothetical protein
MRKIMQQTFSAIQLQTWLLMFINQLAAMIGLQVVSLDADLVQQGWRQIPDGHQSFDPALAEHFRQLKMRNGKHINLAVTYSIVAKWNASNKRRGQAEWTYGSDRHYAENYTDVDRKTWGQHMEDLAKLGLVVVSQMKGKPAYKVVPYEILNAQLTLVHAPGYVHDAQKVARDAQGYGRDAHPITESYKTEESGKQKDLKPAANTARAAAAGEPITKPSGILDDVKPESPDVRPAVASDEGDNELLSQQIQPANLPRPIPPSSAPPPCPDDLKAFFDAAKPEKLEALIERHGLDRIRDMIETVKKLPNIKNPPGMVIDKLGLGAQPAWKWPTTGAVDGKAYIRGKYADYIES